MDRNELIQSLFDKAVDLPPDERATLLEAECDDPEIRAVVMRYLEGFDHAPAELSRPLIEDPEVMSALGASVAGFRLIRLLGRGGMGDVYLAQDTTLKRPVAVKTIAPRLLNSEKAIGRFRHEAQAAARLDHPSIVRVFSYGEDAGTHYIAMSYVDGVTLAQRLESIRHPSLSSTTSESDAPTATSVPAAVDSDADWISQSVALVTTVADALEYAHQNQIIHRDVKPSNILLDGGGRPHLTDFGIAKICDAEPLTVTGEFTGTCHYASPEQAAARQVEIDHRTDVFSLGVVLYELLAQRRPFVGETPQQILEAVRTQRPAPLRSVNPSIPRDLATICHKALEKQPKDRYQSAGHMAADLRAFSRQAPILARPPGIGRRVAGWGLRHRRPLIAGVVVLLIASIGYLIQERRLDARARDCHLSIDSTSSKSQVYLQQYDNRLLTLHDAQSLGSAPVDDHPVAPGQYRVTVCDDSGRFAETSIYLPKMGESYALTLEIPNRDHDYFGGMVLCDTKGSASTIGFPGGEDFEAQRSVSLPPFWIDKCEVSNSDYKVFVDATHYRQPGHWERFGYDPKLADFPVVAVTWEDAQAYARWRGKRLPTAEEWEFAARFADGRLLPWGSGEPADWRQASGRSIAMARSADWQLGYEAYTQSTSPVNRDSHPSSLGLLHTFGNVAEMTESVFSSNMTGVVAKGGTWFDAPGIWDLSRSIVAPVYAQSLSTGFRCAASARPPSTLNGG
ncbi:MAG: SUMF1/EgtB/PvdO family nonheme iron enzyme [Phycisphaerales bacterium]|nr:SUMF1/EgtB/PvdO family nonheme iron enzyme [Phycisphaerales bacterium]MCB9854721.1 SUMF1/EgtB/PvdO family nonheme iron enzyme [Phycisphaerales bacterium]